MKSKQHKRRFSILDKAAEETINAEIHVMRSLIFQQRPPQPPPQTPNVSVNMTNLAPQILVTCYIDPQSRDFIVGPQTTVIVENDDGALSEHTTKEKHVHHGTTSSSGSTAMMNKTHHQFATGHAKWPYMFVLRSLFETEKKSDPFGKECIMFLDEFGNVPEDDDIEIGVATIKSLAKATRSPLTKKQIKLMRKKNVCPDCKQRGLCWSVGREILGQQKYKCANCSSMFNMTPMGTDRI